MTQKISVAVKEEKIDDTLMPEVHVSEASMELQNHVVVVFSVITSNVHMIIPSNRLQRI